MDLSETIVAAIIGALATMATAIVQLIRNRSPEGTKPKKNRMRSLLATIALMIGCIVGGYAWSSLRAVSANEEMRATMKAEFAEQFAALAARKEQVEAQRASQESALAARHGDSGSEESLAQLPPCRIDAHPDEVGPVTCNAAKAQTVALCAAIPAPAVTGNLHVFARVPNSEATWQERDAGAPTLGSLRIATSPTEHAVNADQRAVCLDVSNWSVEDTLAVRLVVEFSFAPAQPGELTASAPASQTL